MNDKHMKSRVAIIGTGLAGLSSAYLIKGDRYRVTLFEQVRHVVNDNRDPSPWVGILSLTITLPSRATEYPLILLLLRLRTRNTTMLNESICRCARARTGTTIT